MNFLSRPRQRKSCARKDPEDVIRAFLRVLEKIAPRASGGSTPAPLVAREKP